MSEKADVTVVPRTMWNRFWGIPGVLGAVVLVLDQVTKWAVNSQTAWGWSHDVIPGFFNLVHVRNTGAAWGMFGEHTWALGALSLICFAALIWWFDDLTGRKTSNALLFGALSGGIAGNMVDRIFRGSVIDFLDFHWREVYHYPSFNVADIAICVAVFCLIAISVRESMAEKRARGQKGKESAQ